MNYTKMTKSQLIEKIEELTIRNAELESIEGLHKSPESVKEAAWKNILPMEEDMRELELADIIDIPTIQSLVKNFYNLVRVTVAIVDLKGNVLVSEGWQDICTKFHRIHFETCRGCNESDTQLSSGVPFGEYKLYKCLNNMWDAATPIVVGGKHIGNVFTGQFFFDDEPVDYELFRSQARRFGFPEEEYMAALEDVPRLSRQSLDAVMSFFMRLAQIISQLSYSNITLAQSLAERDTLMNSLQVAEEKYRGIFENAVEGIYRTTPSGRFLEVNTAFARILGYNSPDALKDEISDLGQQIYVDPEVRKKWISFINQEGYARFEVQMRRKEGNICWVCLRAQPVRDAEGETIYYEGFAEDITERKQIEEELRQYHDHLEELVTERTSQLEERNRQLNSEIAERNRVEEALRESENMYRTIFENTGTATLIFDEDTTISLINAEHERMFHYPKEEVEGKKSWRDMVLKEDLERLMGYHRLRGTDPEAAPRKYELQAVDRYGHIRDVYVTIARIPGTKNRVASLLDITPLKETERALRESEMHYQALFDHAGVAIAELDAQGKHLSFNNSLVEFTGYTREELDGMTGADVIHPDYIEETQNLRRKQVNGEIDQFTIEKCYIHKDGTLRWGELNSTPIRDEQGKFRSAVMSITDITERKKAEEALSVNEALYRNLFENAPIGMFQTAFEEGRFLRVNSAYATMLGYESPEDLMSSPNDVATLHVDPKDRAALLSTLKKQDWFYGEYGRFRKDGSTMIGKVAIRRILKSDGTIDYIEGIVEDVTERKNAEEALKRYAEEITDLYENAPCGYHSLGKDGTYLRINKTELAWLGYSHEEMIGKKFTDLLPPEEVKIFGQGFAVLKDQGEMHNIEGKLIRKNGEVFPVLINAAAIYDENGNYLMSRSSVFDNTERKRAEEALVRSERELRIQAHDLMEVNTTMKVLLNTMEKDQEELKERFLDNIKTQVLPYLEKLKKRTLQDVEKGFVEMAEFRLNEIASPFVQKLTSNYLNLTKTEIRIATLVKEGKSSKEIAELLNSKKRVIDFHRENIRKKLGLNNKKESLAILLRSFS